MTASVGCPRSGWGRWNVVQEKGFSPPTDSQDGFRFLRRSYVEDTGCRRVVVLRSSGPRAADDACAARTRPTEGCRGLPREHSYLDSRPRHADPFQGALSQTMRSLERNPPTGTASSHNQLPLRSPFPWALCPNAFQQESKSWRHAGHRAESRYRRHIRHHFRQTSSGSHESCSRSVVQFPIAWRST